MYPNSIYTANIMGLNPCINPDDLYNIIDSSNHYDFDEKVAYAEFFLNHRVHNEDDIKENTKTGKKVKDKLKAIKQNLPERPKTIYKAWCDIKDREDDEEFENADHRRNVFKSERENRSNEYIEACNIHIKEEHRYWLAKARLMTIPRKNKYNRRKTVERKRQQNKIKKYIYDLSR